MLGKIRLGDDIEDYCPRCRLLLEHNVASMIGNEVVKVVCRTCFNEHPYRQGRAPSKNKSKVKSLLAEVGAKAPKPAVPPSAKRRGPARSDEDPPG